MKLSELSEEDEQKAKGIAQRVKTVEQYQKLEDRIEKKWSRFTTQKQKK